eukprot:18358-Heterococcus_DN1.PRE.1
MTATWPYNQAYTEPHRTVLLIITYPERSIDIVLLLLTMCAHAMHSITDQYIALLSCCDAAIVMKRTGEAFEPDKDKTTNQLSAFFSVVVQKLLQTLTRDD